MTIPKIMSRADIQNFHATGNLDRNNSEALIDMIAEYIRTGADYGRAFEIAMTNRQLRLKINNDSFLSRLEEESPNERTETNHPV